MKPGAVVTHWAKSRGEHANELSKAEFREACVALGLKGMEPAAVDAVFDTYDAVRLRMGSVVCAPSALYVAHSHHPSLARLSPLTHRSHAQDGGGYMDENEAKEMIKGLQKIAEDAGRELYPRVGSNPRTLARRSPLLLALLAPCSPLLLAFRSHLLPAVAALTSPLFSSPLARHRARKVQDDHARPARAENVR